MRLKYKWMMNGGGAGLASPWLDCFPVTPHDTNPVHADFDARGLLSDTDGTVRVVMADETSAAATRDFPMKANVILKVCVRLVKATGTSGVTNLKGGL